MSYEEFEALLREELFWTEEDYHTSEFRIDMYTTYKVYMTYVLGKGLDANESHVFGWADYVKLFNFGLDYSNEDTPYQLFSNYIMYCLHHEVAFYHGTAMIRLGIFTADSASRRNFWSLYDQFVMRHQLCPVTLLDTKDKIGYCYSQIILAKWGVDLGKKNNKKSRVEARVMAEFGCIAADVTLSNDMSKNFTDDNFCVLEFPKVSMGEIYDPVVGARLKDTNFFELLGFKLKEMGLDPGEMIPKFLVQSGGCHMHANHGVEGVIDLFRDQLEQYRLIIRAEMGRKARKQLDLMSDEYYVQLFKQIGTSGSVCLPSNDLVKGRKIFSAVGEIGTKIPEYL